MSKAEARVILDLICRGSSPGTCVEPHLYWPVRDNQDLAMRRAFVRLEAKGFISPAPGYRGQGWLLNESMFTAYRTWYLEKGWRDEEFEGAHLP